MPIDKKDIMTQENEGVRSGQPGMAELKNMTYGIAGKANGQQADKYSETTKAVAQYVGRVYGREMKTLVLLGKETVRKEPEYPKKESKKDEAVWRIKMDYYLKKIEQYDENKAKVFTIIMGQCEKSMKNRVESDSCYEKMEEDNDVVALLKVIKNIAFNTSDKNYPPLQAAEAWKSLSKLYQGDTESLVDFYNRFVAMKEVVERSFGAIAPSVLAEKEPSFAKSKQKATDAARDKMLAAMFMAGADRKRFGMVLKRIMDDYAVDQRTKFPVSLEEALEVLTMKESSTVVTKKSGKGKEETPVLSFAQQSSKRTCWVCGSEDHVKKTCPVWLEQQVKGQQHTQTEEAPKNPWQL